MLYDHDSPWWNGERALLIAASLEAAVADLIQRLGPEPDRWRWDALQHVEVNHELGSAVPVLGAWLNRGPYPWGGGNSTVGRARYRYTEPFRARTGATVRVVAEMTVPIRARAVIPGGQSGHPLSAHYADQLPAWLAGEYYAIASSPPERPTTVLLPAP